MENILATGGRASSFGGDGARPEIWIAALDQAFDAWPLSQSERIADLLDEAFPGTAYLATIRMLLHHAPARRPEEQELELEEGRSVLIARHSRAVGTLLIFTGMAGRVCMPLKLADRWFSAAQLNRIYLRDTRRSFFRNGIADLGDTFEESVVGLRRAIDALGGGSVFLLGVSMGGYPALRYALPLGAEAALVFAGATNITRAFIGDAIDRFGAQEQPDLRPAYAAAERPPRVRLVYADGHADDVRQADNFRGLPGVICEPLPNCTSHLAILEAIRTGKYPAMLEWLLEQDRSRPRAGRARAGNA